MRKEKHTFFFSAFKQYYIKIIVKNLYIYMVFNNLNRIFIRLNEHFLYFSI